MRKIGSAEKGFNAIFRKFEKNIARIVIIIRAILKRNLKTILMNDRYQWKIF